MTPTGACPAWGLRAPAPPGMGTVLPRLGSGLQRGGRPAHPAGTAKPGSGWGGCRLWGAVGCRRVSPIIVLFTGPPALLAPTGAAPACASSPRAGVRRLWAVQGGGGGTRGAPERHGRGHAGVSGLCPGCIGVFQAAKRGCNQRGHGFHQGVSLGAHQRVPGGQTGDSVGVPWVCRVGCRKE